MKKKTLINCIFVLGLLLALLAGLARALLRPREINYYENRYAIQMPAPSLSGLLDGSYQDAAEEALADQLPGAPRLKRMAHLALSTYLRELLIPLSERLSDRVINVGGLQLHDGYLLYWFRSLEREQADLDRRIANYNAIFAAAPETEFYVYYAEKDTDIDLLTGEISGISDYLRDNLDLPADHFGCLQMRSFEDIRGAYYRTDHHWSYLGSRRGYREVLALVTPEETPMTPAETLLVGPFSGSKAKGDHFGAFREDFYADRYDYPEMEICINGAPASDYGAQEIYFSGTATDTLSYSTFYGKDYGYVSFRVPANAGKGDLLIIGDSFDNALLKRLSSHFENTWSVDLRYYEVQMGRPFRLGEFLEAHPGAKVLLCGNLDFFVLEDFDLEG